MIVNRRALSGRALIASPEHEHGARRAQPVGAQEQPHERDDGEREQSVEQRRRDRVAQRIGGCGAVGAERGERDVDTTEARPQTSVTIRTS